MNLVSIIRDSWNRLTLNIKFVDSLAISTGKLSANSVFGALKGKLGFITKI